MKKSTKKKINKLIADFNEAYPYKLANIACKLAIIAFIWVSWLVTKWTCDLGVLVAAVAFCGPMLFVDTGWFEEDES